MSVTRGDPGRVRGGVNRRGREKRRGRNTAAEVRPRMVDATSWVRWRGMRPQERSLDADGRLKRPEAARAGRKARSSEGEMKFTRGANRFL